MSSSLFSNTFGVSSSYTSSPIPKNFLLLNWIAFMVLPVVTTVEENAKKLLNSKG